MNNLRFSKKIWWSIAKISRYDEMIDLGLKKAVKYMIGLIALMVFIFSLVGGYVQGLETQKISKYLDENVPKFKIENIAKEEEEPKYKFKLESDEVIILDNQDLVNKFKSVVVLNVDIKDKQAIKEYYQLAKDGINCIVFLKDKCIMISSKYNPENENQKEGITKYDYSEVLNKIGPDFTEFEKKDLLVILSSMSFSYYLTMYFTNYFVILLAAFALNVMLVGVLSVIIGKILKKDITKKKIFSLTMYSFTLSIILYIIYLIINYFVKINIQYINLINMFIAFIYVLLYFCKNNKKEVA